MLISSVLRSSLLAVTIAAALAVSANSQQLPPSTAIPVVLTQSVAAGQAHPGDVVRAKTIQTIDLPGGRILPAGTALTGHVIASAPFVFDATPYAAQKPSVLSIRFDTIAGEPAPVALSVRAVAGPVASHQAATPQGLDEIDWAPAQTLIGGETTSALEKTVLAPNGSIAGYRRPQGVFARLLAAPSVDPGSSFTCEATATEQSLGIFSANACGVYGLNTVTLTSDGNTGGAFVLASNQRTVKLYAGSTALLQVMPL
jgi:hypothetical protein